MFQSLSGFQVRCNNRRLNQNPSRSPKFQSLSGFQVRCNTAILSMDLTGTRVVSIPIGFSSSLQQVAQLLPGLRRPVSIPIGFSSSLQLSCDVSPHAPLYGFQSLSGFQVRCNGRLEEGGQIETLGFNPYRVFKFVATPIPISAPMEPEQGFNPYRVFKFVATTAVRRASSSIHVFQSLSGFQVRCNAFLHCLPEPLIVVSIPIGFSSSLQRRWARCLLARGSCFNPYRVFKFVATLQRLNCDINRTIWFQSLSGFQVRCNIELRDTPGPDGKSFNPYRVFKFVATLIGCRLGRG